MSAKTKPSRSTVSPTTTSMGRANIGPAVTQVWNSPRSPHGSAQSGRSASSAASIRAPGQRGIERRADRRCSRRPAGRRPASPATAPWSGCLPQRKQRRQAGAGEALLAIAAHVFEEQVAERHVGEAIGQSRRHRRAMRRFVLLVAARPRQRHDAGAASPRPGPGLPARRAGRRASRPGRRPRWSWSAGAARPQGSGSAGRAASTPRPCRSTTRPGSSSCAPPDEARRQSVRWRRRRAAPARPGPRRRERARARPSPRARPPAGPRSRSSRRCWRRSRPCLHASRGSRPGLG